MEIKNALITGVGGFLGRALAKQLLQEGATVSGLDMQAAPKFLPEGVKYQQADICDFNNLSGIISKTTQKEMVVFHLAGQAHVARSRLDPMSAVTSNVTGTANLLEACRRIGIQRIVFPSTVLVYAKTPNLPFTESDAVQANSIYAATKLAAEDLLAGYAAEHGFSCRIARLGNVYGPGGSTDSVIGIILQQVRSGGPISIKTLSPIRDFVYRDDVVHGLIALGKDASESGCEVFNLSSGIPTSIRELAETASLLGKQKISVTETEPPSSGVEDRILLSVQKLKTHTQWQPQWSLEAGLRQTLLEMG
ncbi:MAG TPA: NAD(P)-dependent oxidoreductase [Anaerolineales bacterium]|nr:NAD(P)-dependent oxidoreductase [Anaerolineales bacterium]HNA88186.1 NAD(P)-dependent oxidoreductase [Anaerolineales bacterium]HNB35815.1 NAD(P)-dependent oxidoreductase [Anaerolineales bacterium]HNC07777.1 NAD(P)-dependent oxidoreductase [Anaerolineales bacterium]HND93432.1 NAD(P)-dependent oxidoreductase [Anaerolineales bacterium]